MTPPTEEVPECTRRDIDAIAAELRKWNCTPIDPYSAPCRDIAAIMCRETCLTAKEAYARVHRAVMAIRDYSMKVEPWHE